MSLMTPRTRPRTLAVLAVTFAAAVAGCGGSDDANFVDGYNDAVQPLTTLMSDVQPADASDPKSAADSLNKMADGLEQVRADLGELEPPEDAKADFDKLLSSLDKGTDQVRDMASAAENGNLEKLSSATQEFSRTGTDLVTLESKLRTAVEG